MSCAHFEVDPNAMGAGCECGAMWRPVRGWYNEVTGDITDDLRSVMVWVLLFLLGFVIGSIR
jgi:hypothetical protein